MRRPPLVSLLVALALASAQSLAAAERSREARWLADYLRIDSTNPPGREDRAAAYLADILRQEGIGADRYVTPAGRVSLVARLPATVPNAPWIALVHHLDVVPAGEGWSAPPFGGEIIEGDLYGRGAIDTKSLGIAHLAAVVEAARLPERRRGLLLLAVADEENGGGEGMSWLLERHPEILDGVEAALGEGGLNRTVLRRTFFWGIEVAQKRAYWLEASARGRPGHGSSLNPESAAHELVRGLARLVDRPPNWKLQAPVRDFFRAYAGLDSSLRGPAFDADHAVGADGPAKWVPPGWWSLLLDTVQVTGLAAGERPNVAPAEARARLDVRLLPETDADGYLADLAAVLGPAVALSILLETPPSTPSPTGTALWRELSATLAVEAPVVPVMIAGITDSRFLRQRSVPAYGFSPFELEGIEMLRVHGPDERIALDRFDAGVARMRRVVRALVSTEP